MRESEAGIVMPRAAWHESGACEAEVGIILHIKRVIVLGHLQFGSVRVDTLRHRIHRHHIRIEINRGHRRILTQRGLHPRHKQRPYLILILEFYLILRRMDIDIYRGRIYLEFEEVAGLGVRGHKAVEAAEYRLMEVGMPHVAAIDDEELQRIAPACELRARHEAVNLHELRVDLHRQQLHLEIILPDIVDALMQRGGAQVELAHTGVDAHADAVVDERQTLKLAHHIRELHIVALEEFAPCRHIEEYVFDTDARAGIAHAGLLKLYFRAVDEQLGAHLVGMAAGADIHLRYGAYRGKSLPAETHRL